MRTRTVIFDHDHTLTYVAPPDITRPHVRLAEVMPGLCSTAIPGAGERWPDPWPRAPGEGPAFWERFCKPDPQAVHTAAAALGLTPAACCFVDDLAENVSVARSIGMRASQIDRSRPGLTAGGCIGSLPDLIGLLASAGDEPEPRSCIPEPYDMVA